MVLYAPDSASCVIQFSVPVEGVSFRSHHSATRNTQERRISLLETNNNATVNGATNPVEGIWTREGLD